MASRRSTHDKVSASGEMRSSRVALPEANASSRDVDRFPAKVGRLGWYIAAAIVLLATAAKAAPSPASSQIDDTASSVPNDITGSAVNLRTLAGQPTSTLLLPDANGADGYLFDTSGLLKPFGRTLAERGIYFKLGYTGDFGDFASGGHQQGEAGDNQFLYGVDLDLARLVGAPGTKLHVLIVSRFGAADNKAYIGSTYETFSDAGPTVTTRLTEFSVEQSLLAGRLRFLAGRIPVGQEFAIAPVYCQFVSGLCFNLSPFAWPRNSSVGYWPLASWGGRVTFQPTPRTYLKAGAFVTDPASYDRTGWPWNGGWATSPGSGAFFPLELGYTSDPSSRHLPYAVDVGGFYDSSTYNDPLYNQAGQSRLLDHGKAAVDQGRASLYVQGQRVVWRPDDRSGRGLTIFGAVFASAAGHAAANFYFLAGLVDKGPFKGRSADTLGLMSYTVLLNQRVIEAYSDSLVAKGRTGNLSRSETALELNYSAAIAPGVAIKPFLQLVVHPDQIGLSPAPADTHAWVVGFQLSTVLNDTLGLPIMARPN